MFYLSLNDLPERMVIKQQWLPLALYQEAISFFSKYDVAKQWQMDAENITNNPAYQVSKSFKALTECVFTTLLQGRPVTKALLREAFVDYIDTIVYEVEPFLLEEDQLLHKVVDNEPVVTQNEPLSENQSEQLSLLEATEEALDNERIFTRGYGRSSG